MTDTDRYDVHTHVVPPELPLVPARTAAADPRWAEMERDHVRGQLLSPMPELFAAWAPAGAARDHARAFNVWLAAEVAAGADVFRGLGLVPVQAPDLMASLLTEARELGLSGVEIPCTGPDAPLHDSRYEEFFAQAEALGMLVFLHSVGDTVAFSNQLAGSAAVFPARIGEAVAGLIANGVLERHPRLSLLVSHAGGGLPASLARLEFVRGMSPAIDEIAPLPGAAYAARLWFDHLAFDADLLRGLAALAGTDRIVFGSDYPFLAGAVESVLHDPVLPEHLDRAVRLDNPRRLLDSLLTPHLPGTPVKEGTPS
jgi:aminocarboxymuconate-semialdehyde decarboxylase